MFSNFQPNQFQNFHPHPFLTFQSQLFQNLQTYLFQNFQPPPTQYSGDENNESQIPQFSTQIGLENINLESEETTTPKNKRETWTEEEDKLLIASWLEISKDAVMGTDQKSSAYWNRVMDYYNERGREKNFNERSSTQVKPRWQKIN
jgi:hypothetical protein